MGTDISMHFEKREPDGTWVPFEPDVPCTKCDAHPTFRKRRRVGPREKCWECTGTGQAEYACRDYGMFAILGDARNQETKWKSIAPWRGPPSDMSDAIREWHEDRWEGGIMSYATLRDLLEFDWNALCGNGGIISREKFLEWGGDRPGSYSRGLSGPGIRVVRCPTIGAPPPGREGWLIAVGNPSHVYVRWAMTYREAAGERLAALIEALKKVGPPDDVRLLFGFS